MSMEWGQGKVEVYALRDEILERLERGQTIRSIYEELYAAGRIVVSQRPFYRHVTRIRSEASQSTSPNQQRSAGTTRRARSSENQSKPSPVTAPEKNADPVRATASLGGLRFDGPRSTSSAPRIDDDLWGGSGVKTRGGSS